MSAPTPGRVLLGTQLAFNVGFYAVVPFLALVLREDHLLGGAAIGLVLGLRTFAQQGLFLVGGALCDLFGARRLILAGCVVRVVGFALLGLAPDLVTLVLGAVLTGVGGALFSPAVETLVSAAEERRAPGPAGRPTLFARLAVVGELGAVLGPLVGALLIGRGFTLVALSGAALFAVIGLALARLLPPDPPLRRSRTAGADRDTPRLGAPVRSAFAVLRHRRFAAFAALHAVNLLAWNQLYLGLPVEVDRVGGDAAMLAAVLAGVSVVTILLQLPVARWARTVGPARALPTGYALLALGFWALAATAPFTPPPGWAAAPAVTGTVLLVLGHLVAGPVALDQVSSFAGDRPRGAYFGLLATTGGVAVLLVGVPLGALYDLADRATPAAALPWLAMGVLPALSAVGMALLLRTRPTDVPADLPTDVPTVPTPDRKTSHA